MLAHPGEEHIMAKHIKVVLEYIAERVTKCLRRALLPFNVSQEKESRYEGRDIELSDKYKQFQAETEEAIAAEAAASTA
jgi:hypothetical protein